MNGINEPATPKSVWKTSGISPGLSAIPPFSESYHVVKMGTFIWMLHYVLERRV